MKTKIPIALFAVVSAVFFVYSQIKIKPFALAEDFPREALLYVQVADLPAMIRLWRESEVKENYLGSENFAEFSNRHLGRKLASRWREFSDAAGFPINLETVGNLAADQAAIAVYDIGKLEFVFITPLSDEIFAATKFAQNREKFSEETFNDNVKIYRTSVRADRGRQKQELIFAQIKGRFILTTSEKLLKQTVNNINGDAAKNRLSDEPLFKAVSEKIEPRAATVWLNQTALNDDYYFKRYWLMSDASDLKNIRAGIFVFEIAENKIVERRRFLLDKITESSPVSKEQIVELKTVLPENVPFFRLESIEPETINRAIKKTVFFRETNEEKVSRRYFKSYYSFAERDYYDDKNYESPSADFDEAIDEINEDERIQQDDFSADFSSILRAAKPQAILTFGQPESADAPLFANFKQAAVFYLAAEKSLDRNAFERAILQKFSARMMIGNLESELKWETKNENNRIRRELNFPMLSLRIGYAVQNNLLIVANDSELLKNVLTTKNPAKEDAEISSVTSLTSVNLAERENAYDEIFNEISRQDLDESFFTKNVRSFLETISDVKKIEIKESCDRDFLAQELIFSLK